MLYIFGGVGLHPLCLFALLQAPAALVLLQLLVPVLSMGRFLGKQLTPPGPAVPLRP